MPATLTEAEIHEFRARLCAEAERQFAVHGVEAVTMRSLAKGLGCSAMTPYRYFQNKDEILAAVRASILHRVCDMLEAVGRDQPDGVSWARAHTKAFVDFACREPEAYRLLYDLYQPEGSKLPELAQALERSIRTMTGYVERLIEEGFVQGDARTLGYQYFAAVHGLIGLRMTGLFRSTRGELDASCRALLRLVTAGARARAGMRTAPPSARRPRRPAAAEPAASEPAPRPRKRSRSATA